MKKILLIHGWDYENYTTQTNKKDAWHNRIKFVNKLKKKYSIVKLNLPGFCGQVEPKEKMWSLDDYATYIHDYITKNNLKIDYILGYSFGGAVAVKYKRNYKTNIKLILVSPAIIRNFDNSKKIIKTPKIVSGLRRLLRNIYTSYILKVPEMQYGTKFLRNTYQIIVRDNLIEELNKLNKSDFIIIYGKRDTMVDPINLYKIIDKTKKNNINFIEDGSHDIANTHTNEVIELIVKYTK